MGASAKLRMPTHKGEGTRATHNLTGLGRPLRKFLGVRCGRMKVVSPTLGSVWGVTAELWVPPHEGEGIWATHSLTRLRRPLPLFFLSSAVRCGPVQYFVTPQYQQHVVTY